MRTILYQAVAPIMQWACTDWISPPQVGEVRSPLCQNEMACSRRQTLRYFDFITSLSGRALRGTPLAPRRSSFPGYLKKPKDREQPHVMSHSSANEPLVRRRTATSFDKPTRLRDQANQIKLVEAIRHWEIRWRCLHCRVANLLHATLFPSGQVRMVPHILPRLRVRELRHRMHTTRQPCR